MPEEQEPSPQPTIAPPAVEGPRSKTLQAQVSPSIKARAEAIARREPGRSVSQWLLGLILRELEAAERRSA